MIFRLLFIGALLVLSGGASDPNSSSLFGKAEGESVPISLSTLDRALSDQFREETKKTLTRCLQIAEDNRKLVASLIGEETYRDYQWGKVAENEIAAAFDADIQKMRDHLKKTDEDWQSMQAGSLEPERFYFNCYDRSAIALTTAWKLSINMAGYHIDTLRAVITRANQECDQRLQNAQDDTARQRVAAENDRYQNQVFDRVCEKYDKLRILLTEQRRQGCLNAWLWRHTAFANILQRYDVHARAFERFGKLILQEYDLEGSHYSTIIHFAYSSGSRDRIITGYRNKLWVAARKYPKIQPEGSPDVLRIYSAAETSVDNYKMVADQWGVIWEQPTASLKHTYSLSGAGLTQQEPATSLKYRPNQKISLLLVANGSLINASKAFEVDHITIQNKIGSRAQAVRFGRALLEKQLKQDSVTPIEFELDPLLGQLGASINQNALRATVAGSMNGKPMTAESRTLFHAMKHQVILFLPGVFGSEIYTRVGNKDELAYPRFSRDVVGQQPFTRLKLNAEGEPTAESKATRVDLFRKFTLAGVPAATIYDVENQPAVTKPENTPTLWVDGHEMKPYHLVPWAYDWRLRLENNVSLLLNAAPNPSEKIYPPYAVGPSIKQIVQHFKNQNPLLEDRIAIAGHSTGGVIVRRIIMEYGAEGLIEKAFFINTPFYGAPKAYLVFLNGDMGIPFIKDKFMVDIAPNAPIVYYLAPTEQYPKAVAVINNQKIQRQPGQPAETFMKPLINQGQALGIYPKNLLWNRALENQAKAYHARALGEPRIGWNNCAVFWSSSGANTPGAVRLNSARKLYEADTIEGDGTVPLESQYGDFPVHTRIRVPGEVEHVPSPNQPYVWERIIKKITEPGILVR